VSNAHPSSYKVNSTRIKWIATRLRGKVEEQKHGKRVRYQASKNFWLSLRVKLQLQQAHAWVMWVVNWQKVAAIAALKEEEDEEEDENPDTLSENLDHLLQ